METIDTAALDAQFAAMTRGAQRALVTSMHAEYPETGESFCFVCRRATDHRSEHADWQYIARREGLI